MGIELKAVARIYTDFNEKFGIPRQSGIARSMARIVFEPEYRDPEALRGILEFSHLWLVWEFSETKQSNWSPTVRPPKLGGNKRMGVFATRSPYRPNPIALSSVRLIDVVKDRECGCVLIVEGADILDGTPIYDIKPYLSYTDSHPDAVCGFADSALEKALDVIIPDELAMQLDPQRLASLTDILRADPRPGYKTDSELEYGMSLAEYDIAFKVSGGTAVVTNIKKHR